MLNRIVPAISVVFIAAVQLAAQTACAVTPEVPDSYTALLDHFDNKTEGQVHGLVTYVHSVNGLDQALEFSNGSWLEYKLAGWYQWSSTYNPSNISGAIDLWVKPGAKRIAGSFLLINWYSTSAAPPAGYITELRLDSDGRLTFGGWTSITNNPFDTPFSQPHTQLPLGSFTHISYTWSPAGTSIYVNGELDATSSLSYYPALNSTVYLYLNPWGSNVLSAVDELRVSKIARAEMFSCAKGTM